MQVIREGSEVCVSWDFSAAGNLGNWTTEGCFRDSSSDGVVTCQCDHLTNFAVLIVSEMTSSFNIQYLSNKFLNSHSLYSVQISHGRHYNFIYIIWSSKF